MKGQKCIEQRIGLVMPKSEDGESIYRFWYDKNRTFNDVANIVMWYLDVPFEDFHGRIRTRKVADARAFYAYLLRVDAKKTLAEIGDSIGRTHASVIAMVRKIDDMLQYDIRVAETLMILRRYLYKRKQQSNIK